ncbi:unnamed protein product [Mytilus coruscus]|uniref:Uncharacterized protein n=1 Tax=Mytilus coruscus TaxID=42192 RepID=A0A6J8DXL8_MYTCO|nr:unnamed protein product [Mytilus coruscus]
MHLERKPRVNHGEEKNNHNIPEQDAVIKCTQICKQQFSGKSCAKIVQVKIHRSDCPNKTITSYAILDDQSNKTLVNVLDITGDALEYRLTSRAGVIKNSFLSQEGEQSPPVRASTTSMALKKVQATKASESNLSRHDDTLLSQVGTSIVTFLNNIPAAIETPLCR